MLCLLRPPPTAPACKGDATKKICNGQCIPAGSCCASDPAAGAPCTFTSYAAENTCPSDGGACTANTKGGCRAPPVLRVLVVGMLH